MATTPTKPAARVLVELTLHRGRRAYFVRDVSYPTVDGDDTRRELAAELRRIADEVDPHGAEG